MAEKGLNIAIGNLQHLAVTQLIVKLQCFKYHKPSKYKFGDYGTGI